MFGNHVENQLTAYVHGELAESAAQRVAAHVAECEPCRARLSEIRFAQKALQSLPHRDAPNSVWEKIEARIAAEPAAESAHKTPAFRRPFALSAAAGTVALLMLTAPLWIKSRSDRSDRSDGSVSVTRDNQPPQGPRVAWAVESLKGSPRVGQHEVKGRGRLQSGEWLVTDSASSARVAIANIGRADVRPNSRLSLVSSARNEHRMRLERGELHAKVNAPPRLFIVETPSATAVDLGCEYTLAAKPDGSSLLRVMSGWVAMEMAAHASYVPATMACITRPNQIPGTPYRQDAPAEFVEALKRYDFGGQGAADLAEVLGRARKVDALTLWHLLKRAAPEQKRAVFDSLNKLIPAPKAVTFEKVAAADREAMNAWKNSIELVMFPGVGFNISDLAVNLMKMQQKGVKK